MKTLFNSQGVRYILIGGLTTAINYVIYILLAFGSLHYLLANSLAWAGAVIFSYFANRQMVFHSVGQPVKEFFQFVSLRLGTLILENLLLLWLVEWLGLVQLGAKIFVSVITVALNYMACKYKIFKKESEYHG